MVRLVVVKEKKGGGRKRKKEKDQGCDVVGKEETNVRVVEGEAEGETLLN